MRSYFHSEIATYFSSRPRRGTGNNSQLNKCSFAPRDSTFRSRRRGEPGCVAALVKMELWLGLYGCARSYASNRKYRERGNSEIGVNERILRQAAIKELVSLRRLRALCDQFENWHVRTNTFEWSRRRVFRRDLESGWEWGNGGAEEKRRDQVPII